MDLWDEDGLIEVCQGAYNTVCSRITRQLEERGVGAITARKQARGAARGLLGNALETELVWTVNVRALRHFLEMRASEHADAEIRLLANEIFLAALPHIPAYLSDYERVPCRDGVGFGLATKFRKV